MIEVDDDVELARQPGREELVVRVDVVREAPEDVGLVRIGKVVEVGGVDPPATNPRIPRGCRA